jgi:hypothetical protein
MTEYLNGEGSCRLATITLGGPHILPLWYVWAGMSMWLYSSTCSQRCPDLQRNPRGAAVVDTGEFGSEQRGVELRGVVAPVGESRAIFRQTSNRYTHAWRRNIRIAAKWNTTGSMPGYA